jgi:hypothetical protein
MLQQYHPEVVIITEADLPPTAVAAILVGFPGYKVFHPPATKLVRLIGLVKESISVRQLDNFETTDIPTLWLELLDYKLIVGGFYRQFSCNGQKGLAFEHSQLDGMCSMVDAVNSNWAHSTPLLLLGDFNYDMQKIANSSYTHRTKLVSWLEFLQERALSWIPTGPTFVSHGTRGGKHSRSTLDHVYATAGLDPEVDVLPDAPSDHYPLLVSLSNLRHGPTAGRREKLERVQVRDFEGINFDAMNADLAELDTANWPVPPQGTLPDAFLGDLTSLLWLVLDKHAPAKTIKVRRDTPTLRLSQETQRVLRLRDEARASNNKGQYRSLRNKGVKLIKADRLSTTATTLSAADNKVTAAWKLAGSLLRPDKPKPLLAGAKSNQESADLLNQYYLRKVEDLREGLPPPRKAKAKDLVGKDTFSLQYITNRDVIQALKKVSSSRAKGVDGLPICVWKRCIANLATPLRLLVNLSFREASVPASWRTAILNPVLKKNKNPLEPSSWRPVAILPAVSKMLEHVVLAQLLNHVDSLLPAAQHGFRKGRSIITALASSIHRCAEAIDRGDCINMLSWDFSSAFDTPHVDTMLDELRSLGACKDTLAWFAAYLSGGQQAVSWNGVTSGFRTVLYGFRQGSCMGPVLFIIVTRTIPDALSCGAMTTVESTAAMYADDVHNIGAGQLSDIAAEASALCRRMAAAAQQLGLFLNESKTQHMLLNTGGSTRDEFSALATRLARDATPPMPAPPPLTPEIELLGFQLDPNLSVAPYIDKLRTTLRQRLGLIRRLHSLLPPHARRILAAAMTDGLVNTFAVLSFKVRLSNEDTTSSAAEGIQVVINDIARAAVGLTRKDRVHVSDVLDRANILGVNRTVARNAGLLAWQAKKRDHVLHWIHSSLASTSGRLAADGRLRPLKPSVAARSRAVANCIRVWNECQPLRQAKTAHSARKALKSFVRSLPIV